MKLILHIVSKDLTRMRAWIVAWLGVLALPLVLGVAVTLDAGLERHWRTLAGLNVALVALQAVVAYLMVLVLVQEDRLAGTRQFWATRPIGRWQLFLSKAGAALLVIGGGAVVVALPWWWWSGFGTMAMGRAALDYIVLATIVIIPAMLLGALTDSLGRAILWSLAFFAFAIMWLIPATAFAWYQRLSVPLRVTVVTGGWLLAALAVVVALYVVRDRRRVIASAVLAMITWWGASVFLPFDWLVEREPRERNPELGAGVHVRFREAWTEKMLMRPRDASILSLHHVRVRFDATLPRSALTLHGVGAQQTWRWRETELERKDRLNVLGVRHPLRGHVRTSELKELNLQAYAHAPSSFAARMNSEPAEYEARLWLALVRSTVLNEVPLRSGMKRRGDGHRVGLRQVEHTGEGTMVELVDSAPKSWIDGLIQASVRRRWFHDPGRAAMYFVLNPRGEEFGTFSSVRRQAMVVHGVQITSLKALLVPHRAREGNSQEDLRWVENANLAYVGMHAEAVFMREVRVDGFTAAAWGERGRPPNR